jgi:hypothetical protein
MFLTPRRERVVFRWDCGESDDVRTDRLCSMILPLLYSNNSFLGRD